MSSGLGSHRRLSNAFVIALVLQLAFMGIAYGLSILSKRQTQEALEFEVAANRLQVDFQGVNVAMQRFRKEFAQRQFSQPYVNSMQADLGERLSQLERSVGTLVAATDREPSLLSPIDAESGELWKQISPILDAYLDRARQMAEADPELLQLRYRRPSVVELAATRSSSVGRGLRTLAENARRRQIESTHMLYVLNHIAFGAASLLLILSSLLIIRPALKRQKLAILNEKIITGDLARKNAELASAEGRAVALLEKAEQGARAKTEFLAVVSHELRTPLNAVIGFSEVIEKEAFGPVGNRKYIEYANDINKSGLHLLGIVDDILDFSRGEARRHNLSERSIPVSVLLRDAAMITSDRARRMNVRLVFDDNGQGDAILWADQRLVLQALTNLIDNALKFSAESARVDVRPELAEDGGLAIRVKDSGPGIARESISRILKPFEQIESAFSRSSGGLGLGLAIVNGIMEAHGGRVEIDSATGIGSTFGLHFPKERLRSAFHPCQDELEAARTRRA